MDFFNSLLAGFFRTDNSKDIQPSSTEVEAMPALSLTEIDREQSKPAPTNGRDEMNLAEFPFASLRRRGDSRKAIVYEGWVTSKDGSRLQQKWTVRGDSLVGLPIEFDERVYVALMAITFQRGFETRKVPFSIYQVMKIMGLRDSKRDYEHIENALDRLKGVTIKAEGAFWNNEKQEIVRTVMAFNIIDKYWLRYRESDEKIKEEEGVPAYIVWSEDIWKSIKAGYIKSLDLDFYYSLNNPIARRLYRLLDKRMWSKNEYEFDVFDLSGKLGMARYRKPADVMTKLKPALDELVSKGFLSSAEPIRINGYTRIRFVRASRSLPAAAPITKERSPKAQAKKSGEADQAQSQGEGDGQQPAPIVQRLTTLKVGVQKATQLAAAHEPEYIEEKIEILIWKQTQEARGKPIEDSAAWLVRAIEQDYQPPDGFRSRAQLAEEASERERRRQENERLLALQEERERERREHHHQQECERAAQLQEWYGTTAEELEVWGKVQSAIRGEDNNLYHLLFANTYLLSLRDGVARIGVPSEFHKERLAMWANEQRIKSSLKVLGHPVEQLTFEVLTM